MNRRLAPALAVTFAGALALTACGGPTAAPEPAPATITHTVTAEPAEPAPARETTAMDADNNAIEPGHPHYDTMTVTELLTLLPPESETDYNECVDDALATDETPGYSGGADLAELCQDLLVFELEMGDIADQYNG